MSTTTAPVNMARIREDHWKPQSDREDALWAHRAHTSSLGTQLKQGHRAAWWEAIEWVLTKQQQMGALTQGELLAELRKAESSIYWPLLSPDPTIPADCPRCEHRVLIDREGLCPDCAYEFEETD